MAIKVLNKDGQELTQIATENRANNIYITVDVAAVVESEDDLKTMGESLLSQVKAMGQLCKWIENRKQKDFNIW